MFGAHAAPPANEGVTALAPDSAAAIIVLAKSPVVGRVKTRLCPPCSSHQAAALAEAALSDTLTAVTSVPARRVLVLAGRPGPWLPAGIAVLPQRGDGLAERLAAAFADVGGPALLIGMDTPQLSAPLLRGALRVLGDPQVDAVLGPTEDGGYWAIGLRVPCERVFSGIPMSRDDTCARQRERLSELGLRTIELPRLRDVDHMEDAHAVAGLVPRSRFATCVRSIAAAA